MQSIPQEIQSIPQEMEYTSGNAEYTSGNYAIKMPYSYQTWLYSIPQGISVHVKIHKTITNVSCRLESNCFEPFGVRVFFIILVIPTLLHHILTQLSLHCLSIYFEITCCASFEMLHQICLHTQADESSSLHTTEVGIV